MSAAGKNMSMQLLSGISTWRTGWICAVTLLLSLLISAPVVEAAEGKRIALVVGIGTYDKLSADKQLKNAVNDAEGVSAKLTAIGFQVTKVPNLTRSAFNDKWQNVLDSLSRDDTFVLFYSGHGVQIDGQNYLLPRDIPYIEYGRQEQLKREAISLNELLADLSTGDRRHPKSSVVILDACRDNPLIPPGYTKSASTPKGLANVPESDGIFVMYAAANNQTALDRLSSTDKAPYSVFTRTLLPLVGRADLSIQELGTQLKDQVWELTQGVGHRQRPTFYDGIIGRFCLPGCADKAEKGPPEKAEPGSSPEKADKGPVKHRVSPFPFRVTITDLDLMEGFPGKDGTSMESIPAWNFQMGSTKEDVDHAIQVCVKEYKQTQLICEKRYEHELPQHRVELDEFYLDTYEVTNRRFQQFTQQTGYRTTAEREGSAWAFVEGVGWQEVKGANWQKPEAGVTVFNSNRVEHPVVSVSWDDAQAYCQWAGKRLPTEAEIEYATRALTKTQYWWGPGHPGTRRVENITDESAEHLLEAIMAGYDDGAVRTATVGSYEKNPWELCDMSGNVREWTADWYDSNYYGKSPARNPKGPASGQVRVVRGGSWNSVPDTARSAFRDKATPTFRMDNLGFRCAMDALK